MSVQQVMSNALGFAGRNGPVMLLAGVMTGLALPPLAEAVKPFLGLAVFIFTLGAFLKADAGSFKAELANPAWLSAALGWSTFGVPFVAFALVWTFSSDADLTQGIVLAMLAPPVGSAAALAAMLGLSAPLALLATLVASAISPVILPPLTNLLTASTLTIDPVWMTLRLLAIVGGAFLCSLLLRRFADGWVRTNPHAMTGVAVAGLILVAIVAMHGMGDIMAAHPARVGLYLALAFAVNLAFQAVGAALFYRAGRKRSLTIGLVSGNRNVTLIWAATGADLLNHPGVELYLAMSVFPIFILPAIQNKIIKHVFNIEKSTSNQECRRREARALSNIETTS